MKKILILLFLFILNIPSFSRDSRGLEDIIKSILIDNIEGEKEVNNKEGQTRKTPGDITKSNKSDKTSIEKNVKESNLKSIPSPDKVLLDTGRQLFNIQHHKAALEKFNELVTKYPQSPFRDNAALWAAKVYLKFNKYDEAIKNFQSISEDSGEYPIALFSTGEAEVKKGDISKAIEYFYMVSSQFPDHHLADDALLILGKHYISEKRGNEALRTFMKLIKYYKERETIDDAYYFLGKVFENDSMLKDFEIAIQLYRVFLKKTNQEKSPHFRNSPLKDRVESDLKYLESTFKSGD